MLLSELAADVGAREAVYGQTALHFAAVEGQLVRSNDAHRSL